MPSGGHAHDLLGLREPHREPVLEQRTLEISRSQHLLPIRLLALVGVLETLKLILLFAYRIFKLLAARRGKHVENDHREARDDQGPDLHGTASHHRHLLGHLAVSSHRRTTPFLQPGALRSATAGLNLLLLPMRRRRPAAAKPSCRRVSRRTASRSGPSETRTL